MRIYAFESIDIFRSPLRIDVFLLPDDFETKSNENKTNSRYSRPINAEEFYLHLSFS